MLDLSFLTAGKGWIRLGEYDDNGNFCLAGALEFISRVHSLRPDGALDCLLQAFDKPRDSNKFHLWFANDDCHDYAEIEQRILRARALARRELIEA